MRVEPLTGTCPDCGEATVGGRLKHADTCPLFAALEAASADDAAWFAANPGQKFRTRPTTPAERTERRLFGHPADPEVRVAFIRRRGPLFTSLLRFEPSGNAELNVTAVAR